MKNKYILIALVVLVLAGGVGYSYYNFHKPVKEVEIKDSPFSVYLPDQKDTFSEVTEWYEAKVEYPKNNQKVRDIIFQKWEDFEKENQLKKYTNADQAREELGLNTEGARYTFNTTYKITQSTDTITYIFTIYTFTGGAHGATIIYPVTLNQSFEVLTSEKIIPDASLEKVAQLSYEDLKRQKVERMRSYPMSQAEIDEAMKDTSWLKEGTSPTRDNYATAWPDGDTLVISFGQYQVGPYVEGIYEVKIPKSSI